MRKLYILILYFITIILFLGVLGIGIYKLNLHLKNEYLLIYATGTNEKAFLNSTWKMSPKEIERANKTNLLHNLKSDHYILSLISILDFPKILNGDRYSAWIQKNVLLWGETNVVVIYYFFDNMLLKYDIKLEDYYFEQIPSDIILTLRSTFGNEKKATMKQHPGFADLDELKIPQYARRKKQSSANPSEIEITGKDINLKHEKYPYSFVYVWETQNQFVTLTKRKSRDFCLEYNFDNCYYYNILIKAKYKNLYKEIEEIARQEREDYF